jgi:hypothetical protein
VLIFVGLQGHHPPLGGAEVNQVAVEARELVVGLKRSVPESRALGQLAIGASWATFILPFLGSTISLG